MLMNLVVKVILVESLVSFFMVFSRVFMLDDWVFFISWRAVRDYEIRDKIYVICFLR